MHCVHSMYFVQQMHQAQFSFFSHTANEEISTVTQLPAIHC
jgi:hypothetical protein